MQGVGRPREKHQSGDGEGQWLGSESSDGCQESWWVLGWLSIGGESGGPG